MKTQEVKYKLTRSEEGWQIAYQTDGKLKDPEKEIYQTREEAQQVALSKIWSDRIPDKKAKREKLEKELNTLHGKSRKDLTEDDYYQMIILKRKIESFKRQETGLKEKLEEIKKKEVENG